MTLTETMTLQSLPLLGVQSTLWECGWSQEPVVQQQHQHTVMNDEHCVVSMSWFTALLDKAAFVNTFLSCFQHSTTLLHSFPNLCVENTFIVTTPFQLHYCFVLTLFCRFRRFIMFIMQGGFHRSGKMKAKIKVLHVYFCWVYLPLTYHLPNASEHKHIVTAQLTSPLPAVLHIIDGGTTEGCKLTNLLW